MRHSSAIPSWFYLVILFAAGVTFGNLKASACGRDTDCLLGQRTYRVVLPSGDARKAPRGAIIFVHGYRGSAENEVRNDGLVAVATKHGAAFVAAQAAGIEWNLPGVPSDDAKPSIDELAYFDSLADDLKKRFGIQRRDIFVAGFSSGAMMVWYLACHRGDNFAGFVPISGTFWKPLPKSCPMRSINLIHYHGTEDGVVPIHGRPIKDGHQGDVYEALSLFARAGQFGPASTKKNSELSCTRRSSAKGNILELCLFLGQHDLKPRHLERAWREFTSTR
jgi:polyhydroxybutyrate depolymerase